MVSAPLGYCLLAVCFVLLLIVFIFFLYYIHVKLSLRLLSWIMPLQLVHAKTYLSTIGNDDDNAEIATGC
jgi:hypothetical protein